MTKTEAKLDAAWRSYRRVKPRSKRRDRLEREMVMLQVKRLRAEMRSAKSTASALAA